MKKNHLILCSLLPAFIAANGFAQQQIQSKVSQKAMLYSSDSQLAKNKKLVYDFWREVIEGAHVEFSEKYIMEDYIQHNPLIGSGRKALVDLFAKYNMKPLPIVDTIKEPLIAMVAEGDLVTLEFKAVLRNPDDSTKTYETTAFEMLRVKNGKIAEHWDTVVLKPHKK